MNLSVKVIPNARKTEIRGTMADGTLKIALAAAPEKGKANKELIRFLAAHFHVSRDCVIMKSGFASKKKIIEIKN